MRHRRLWCTALLLAAMAIVSCSRPPADDAERKARVEALYAGYKKDFADAPEISPSEALELWRQDRLLPIDVRAPAERAVSVLPGAVTEKEFMEDPGRFAGKQAVAYCTIGYRSGLFAAQAAPKGLHVRNMAGGLLGWLHAGGTLVDAKGEATKTVHVYGRTWDLAPLGYTSVW
jgi:rhodanese-related sulfurtransferase